MRALLLSTVLARLLKADSTAEDGRTRQDLLHRRRALERRRFERGCRARLSASANSISSSGSTRWNAAPVAARSVAAVPQPPSRRSIRTLRRRVAAGEFRPSEVCSSRPRSIASMSSWLFAAGAARWFRRRRRVAQGAGFAAAGFGGAIVEGGMSFITGAFAAGAGAAGFSGFAGTAAAALSAAGGLASSSAMMRRDRRQKSPPWRVPGPLQAASSLDSTSSTPSHEFYTKQGRNCPFRICRPGFSSHKPDLSPDQAPRSHSAEPLAPAQDIEASRVQPVRESLCCLWERYVRAANDCKNGASRDSCLEPVCGDAFSSREPGTTSLERYKTRSRQKRIAFCRDHI